MKKKIVVAGVLVAVAVAGWLYLKHHREAGGALTLYGNVDIREVNLGFRVGGRLMNLACDEGDKVQAGDVIAGLDDEPYRNQVASAAAQVESLRARLNEREISAGNAGKLFQRSDEMWVAKGVSQQDRDNAETGFKEAQAQLNQTQADLVQAEAALASARLQAKDTILTAPSDGVILTRAQEAGAILQAGATVFTLSLQNPVWVRAYVDEPDLGRIHPGMKVKLYTDSRHDRFYTGQIGFISPRAEFTPKSVETKELRTALVYRLRIVVADSDEGLRQGMPVTVKISGISCE